MEVKGNKGQRKGQKPPNAGQTIKVTDRNGEEVVIKGVRTGSSVSLIFGRIRTVQHMARLEARLREKPITLSSKFDSDQPLSNVTETTRLGPAVVEINSDQPLLREVVGHNLLNSDQPLLSKGILAWCSVLSIL